MVMCSGSYVWHSYTLYRHYLYNTLLPISLPTNLRVRQHILTYEHFLAARSTHNPKKKFSVGKFTFVSGYVCLFNDLLKKSGG